MERSLAVSHILYVTWIEVLHSTVALNKVVEFRHFSATGSLKRKHLENGLRGLFLASPARARGHNRSKLFLTKTRPPVVRILEAHHLLLHVRFHRFFSIVFLIYPLVQPSMVQPPRTATVGSGSGYCTPLGRSRSTPCLSRCIY